MAKGIRVPMRIYRLTGTEIQVPVMTVRPPSMLVQGKTLADVPDTDSISLSSVNFPGISLAHWSGASVGVAVQTLKGEKFVVVKDDHNQNYTFYFAPAPANPKTAGVPDVFEFLINPQHVNPVYNKRLTEVQTRGGWEVQHWGDQLTEIQVQGRSGGMHRDANNNYVNAQKQDIDVTKSLAWQRISQLRTLYQADHSSPNQEDLILVGMNYYDKFFVGYFTTFTGPVADSEKPYIVDFTFTLKIQQELNL
jgi:hypothetical protein